MNRPKMNRQDAKTAKRIQSKIESSGQVAVRGLCMNSLESETADCADASFSDPHSDGERTIRYRISCGSIIVFLGGLGVLAVDSRV